MKKISIIYVSYNSGAEILASVESVLSAGSRHELEIIAIDNASSDGSPERLAANGDMRLIASGLNLGYARAVNLGIAAATGDYYLVLNPDVTVTPGSIDALVAHMEANPRIGLAGAKLLNEDGTLQDSCRSFYTFWTILLRRTPLGRLFPRSRAIRKHLMLDFDHASARAVDWVLGACMLVSRQAVEEVGAMDKRFFLYFEDVDWCYRMNKRGWEVWYVPDSVMTHVHKRASARNPLSRSLIAHILSFIHYSEKWNPVSYVLKRYRDLFKGLTLLAMDALAINGALALATLVRLNLSSLFGHSYFNADAYIRFTLIYNVIVLGTFYLVGLHRTRRSVRASEEFLALLKAGLLAGVTLMSTTFLTHERVVARTVVLVSVPLFILFSLFLRSSLRRLHRVLLRYNFDLRRLLIVGSKQEAEDLGNLVMRHPEIGLEIIGRIAVGESERNGALGREEDLRRVSEDERVQEILFAPSVTDGNLLAETITWCRTRNVDLRVLSELTGVIGQRANIDEFLGLPAISYRMGGVYPLQRFLKRCTDMAVALPALLLTFIPGLLHLLISRSGGGGLRRRRLALLGGRFCTLALPMRGGGGKIASDLLNPWAFHAVLVGRLSLVGPMPRLSKSDRSESDPPPMRPGLTGYWRESLREERSGQVERLDTLYRRGWSPGLDIQIWLGTMIEQLRGHYPVEILSELGGENESAIAREAD